MTGPEAHQLAITICQTWRTPTAADIWAEELAALDHQQALTAYRQLRKRAEQTPTIPAFHATYRQLNAPDRYQFEAPSCGKCANGWAETTYEHRGHRYEGVRPCHCPAGERHQELHQRINTHNERHRHGHG